MSRTARALVVAALALTTVAVAGSPAAAGVDGTTSQSRTFRYCGTTDWRVPDDVASLQVQVDGAEGGEGDGNGDWPEPASAGGGGGRTIATVPVTPGELLTVVVGCQGQDYAYGPDTALGGAGYGTGGDGGQAPGGYANAGGGGGGGSAILRGSGPIVVAGGGGGGGASGSENDAYGGAGAGGNDHGETGGSLSTVCGGGGGTGIAPGPGGDGAVDGDPGVANDGGNGAFDPDDAMGSFTTGGGGGGGYFGGGGGGAIQNSSCGGGGGGSGYLVAEATGVTATNGAVTGDGQVRIDFSSARTPAPSNDDDVDAIELTDLVGTTPTVDNTGAGAEMGEPAHAGEAPARSVWYRFEAPFDGRAVLDTAGSNTDTVLAVYTADLPSRDFSEVAANDDSTDATSKVTFPIVEGTTYYVAVDGAPGTVQLSHRFVQPRPDARIRIGAAGRLKGDGVYSTLTGQTVTAVARAGRTVTYRASIQNDSGLAERFRLRGQPSARRMTVRYRTPAGVNITRQVVAGTYRTPAVPANGAFVIRIEVELARNVGRVALPRTLRATSVIDPDRTDTVRFTTRRR